MYRFDEPEFKDRSAPVLQRARGEARVAFKRKEGRTRLQDLFQSGSAKMRLPRIYTGAPTAVLINTAGGLTGGDRMIYRAATQMGAHAIVTTQTAERAYRSSGGAATVSADLAVSSESRLEWLPQETILFDRSALARSLTADLAGTAGLLCLEAVVIGRPAMGEVVEHVQFSDRWRIRRDGKLVYADDIRLHGNPSEVFKGPATANGGTAFATLIDCDPAAEERLSRAREALEAAHRSSGLAGGCSAWNGVLTARFVASDGRTLKQGLSAFLTHYRDAQLPRVWQI
ncbi:urease accessory protein UreD [Roseibium aquae]|uniref:Urease accessory protein UreD n=1 Tax=Roseibium aquae TaxID=1323746 RepID=A0A916TCP9_9HYPH|nr:urease accessory protein UreD [Roseibium aquae]GGB39910.1 urease accessory protein UreD [Roseibium aquae]